MLQIREPAVAGQFYTQDPQALEQQINNLLGLAVNITSSSPKAIIVPHAGFIYSGEIAATAYACLASRLSAIKKVVLLGPSHHVYFQGIAASSADYWKTPLGNIPMDKQLLAEIAAFSHIQVNDEPHRLEHSLEVQLPFLQVLLDNFSLLPLVVGDSSPADIAEVLSRVWGGNETLIVVSSDLSHFHDYHTACDIDSKTSKLIEKWEYTQIEGQQACGCRPVNGLLCFAEQNKLRIETLDLRNSGDTAGSKDRVVGYGAYAIYQD